MGFGVIIVFISFILFAGLPLLVNYIFKIAGVKTYSDFRKGLKVFMFASWTYYNVLGVMFILNQNMLYSDSNSFSNPTYAYIAVLLYYPMFIAQITFIKSLPENKIGIALFKLCSMMSTAACFALFVLLVAGLLLNTN